MARNVRVEKVPEFVFFVSIVGRRTVVGRLVDDRRTVVGGADVVSGTEENII